MQTGPGRSRQPSVRQECLFVPGTAHTGLRTDRPWAESRPLPREPGLLHMANGAGPSASRTSRYNINTIHKTHLLSWKPVSQKIIIFYNLFLPLIVFLKLKLLWSKLALVVYTPNVFQLTSNSLFKLIFFQFSGQFSLVFDRFTNCTSIYVLTYLIIEPYFWNINSTVFSLGITEQPNQVIGSFLNEVLNQRRFRNAWLQVAPTSPLKLLCSHIPACSLLVVDHALSFFLNPELGRVMFSEGLFPYIYLFYLQVMVSANKFHKTRSHKDSRHNYENSK